MRTVTENCSGATSLSLIEDIEGGSGTWKVVVHPFEDSCSPIELPTTKKEFVEVAAKLGIEWDIDDVADQNDIF